jgi:hypothetical protein
VGARPEQFQRRRVKIVGYAVNITCNVADAIGEMGDGVAECTSSEALNIHTEERQLLAQAVVQVSRDAMSF